MYGVDCRFQERNRFNSTDTDRHKEQILHYLVKSSDLLFSLEQISQDGGDQTEVEEEEEGPGPTAQFAAPELLGVPLLLPVRHDGR